MARPTVSVVLSTYRKPRELAASLAALERARRPDDDWLEVLVADDGSGDETREVIEEHASRAPFRIEHVHHADEGFRLARIRNLAIGRSRGEVLVFIDGDSLVHPEALELHARRCRPGRAHAGARCFLDEAESARVLVGELEALEAGRVAARREAGRRRRRYLESLFHRTIGWKMRPKLIGGNCAIHRQDLERINGFDERFVGWGLEDDDLARRLRDSGTIPRDGTLDCLVTHLFHLTHPSHRPTMHHTPNYRYFHRGRALARCRYGLETRPLASIPLALEGSLPRSWETLRERLRLVSEPTEAEAILAIGAGRQARHRDRVVVDLDALHERGEDGEGVLAHLEERL